MEQVYFQMRNDPRFYVYSLKFVSSANTPEIEVTEGLRFAAIFKVYDAQDYIKWAHVAQKIGAKLVKVKVS